MTNHTPDGPGHIRTLTYRPHLKWMYYIVLWAAAIFLILNVIFSGFLYLNGSGAVGMVALFFGIFVSVLLWAEARFLLRPMAFAVVKVFNDRAVVDRVGKVFEIHYTNIAQVKLAKVAYVGGWFTLIFKTPVEGKKKLKFTVVLERSEYLLDAIHKHSPELFTTESLESYRRTAVYSDHSWGRMYANAARWPLVLLKYVGVPLAAGFVAYLLNRKAAIVLAPVGFIAWAYVVFVAQEFILGYRLRRRLKENVQDLRRDTNEEKSLLTKAQYVYCAGAVIGLILLFI